MTSLESLETCELLQRGDENFVAHIFQLAQVAGRGSVPAG
jgi:hypothetical protein